MSRPTTYARADEQPEERETVVTYEVEWWFYQTSIFDLPYLTVGQFRTAFERDAREKFREMRDDLESFDCEWYRITTCGREVRRESLTHEAVLSEETKELGKRKIAEIKANMMALRFHSISELDDKPRAPRSAADVVRVARPAPEPDRAPWVAAADDPESVWSIPDDVIDAYAAEADSVYHEPMVEDDPWHTRKDLE